MKRKNAVREDDVIVKREVIMSVGEHQTLLSFNSDWMSECFNEWWLKYGRKEWAAFAEGWQSEANGEGE
jgi:hypothetical protein